MNIKDEPLEIGDDVTNPVMYEDGNAVKLEINYKEYHRTERRYQTSSNTVEEEEEYGKHFLAEIGEVCFVKQSSNCRNDKEAKFDIKEETEEEDVKYFTNYHCWEKRNAKDLKELIYKTHSSNLVNGQLDPTKVAKKEKGFRCAFCPKKFEHQSKFIVHLRIHSGEKPFSCDICKSKFSRKSDLNVHMRRHTSEKLFSCDICKSKFSRKFDLDVHMRRHTGEKPFMCDICTSKFSRKSHLETHMRRHAGEKPFKCDICKSKFSGKSDLERHMRRHTGEKPFMCDVCMSKFSQKSGLKRHMRTHTG